MEQNKLQIEIILQKKSYLNCKIRVHVFRVNVFLLHDPLPLYTSPQNVRVTTTAEELAMLKMTQLAFKYQVISSEIPCGRKKKQVQGEVPYEKLFAHPSLKGKVMYNQRK